MGPWAWPHQGPPQSSQTPAQVRSTPCDTQDNHREPPTLHWNAALRQKISQQTIKTANEGQYGSQSTKIWVLRGSTYPSEESFKVGDKEAEPAAGKKRSWTGNKAQESSWSAMSVGRTNRPSSACPNLIWGPKLLKYYCYWRSLTRTHLCDLEESEFNKISI